MKRLFTLLCMLSFLSFSMMAQTRYVDEVFTDVDVLTDEVYGSNFTVLFFPIIGTSARQDLEFDIYSPAGDTETDRPLILMFHTGNFLPQLVNGQINGDKADPYLVDMAMRFARRGYVVASVDYRQGWDPLNPVQESRVNTLINAAWRGVQDANTAVRYFRKSVAEDNNPYGINPDQIATFGLGTGGYITLAQATIDAYLDVVLPKFIGSDITGDGIPDPMVIEPFNGDYLGETLTGITPFGDTLAVPNHPGYSSEVQLCVNVGGALGDTSWIDSGDPPMIGFQVPTDPFAPYLEDILIVPTTGDLIVEVQGAGVIIPKANELGNNAVFANGIFDDPYTARANALNGGNEGLFPFHRPVWDLNMDGTPETAESSPWDWWDVATWSTEPLGQFMLAPCEGIPIDLCNWHLVSLANNPDMSFEKANTYIDSIMNYFAPRACLALGLDCAYLFTDTEDVLEDDSFLSLSPNPADESVFVSSDKGLIRSVGLFSIDGQLVYSRSNIDQRDFTLNRNNLTPGIYFLKTAFDEGILTKRIVFQ